MEKTMAMSILDVAVRKKSISPHRSEAFVS
jgi:hypothetical protein